MGEETLMASERALPSWKILSDRRRHLGMSYAVLARKSGVSMPTVVRILSGASSMASLGNVAAIAEVLGLCIQFTAVVGVEELRERQARQKAGSLMGMLQGTSGLEGQALDADALEVMEKQTVHELLAGSNQRLWND